MSDKRVYLSGVLSGFVVSSLIFSLWSISNRELISVEVEKVERKITCPDYVNQDGMIFAGYGKMELQREGIFKGKAPNIFTWSLDKEETELYIAKSNARNFGADIDIRYKIVEVYYKDVDSVGH